MRRQVRGVSKKAGLKCVLQTVASRGMLLPVPVVGLPAIGVDLLERGGMMPKSPRARMFVQVGDRWGKVTAVVSYPLGPL